MKKFFITVSCVVLCVFLSACKDPLFVKVDEKNFASDFASGEEKVTVADLPSFTGKAITTSEFNTMLDSFFESSGNLYSSVQFLVTNSVAGMDSIVSDSINSRTVDTYSAFALAIANEKVTPILNCVIDIESLNLAVSGYNNLGNTVISDWFNVYTGSSNVASLTLFSTGESQFGFDTKSKVTYSQDGLVLTGIWHHGNILYSKITDGSFTINSDTGNFSGNGTLDLKSNFNSSLGFTISSIDMSGNGKYVIDFTMKEINVKDVPMASLISDTDNALNTQNANTIDQLIARYFFENANDYLNLTITAYDNSNAVIATKTYTGTKLLELLGLFF